MHWEALWDDVLAQYESDEEGEHFMGAIVSIPARTVPVGVTKHLVIDGQQRLTTVALLLCALRQRVDQRNKGRIDDYLTNKHFDDPERLKIVPAHGDRKAYASLVDGLDYDDEHPMTHAVEFFLKKMKGMDTDDKPIDADRLLQVISRKFLVVMINLTENDDPFLTFESLNFRGEPLTQADLVRNYVLMQFEHSSAPDGGEQERVHRYKWLPMEELLGDHLQEFLRHCAMTGGDNVRKGHIYAALKRHFSS